MSSPAITVESLGKRYRIRHQQQDGVRYKVLRDVLADKTKGVARRLWSALRPTPHSALRTPPSEDFWALKDVSFEIRQGEVMGIIGRNGAGKSTLLKILSRITEPTSGRVRILGRVGCLLEVGTGFHQELTGRENIFLNGAILGMSRSEIKNRFEEIVAFAGVEKFLDTPVKRYSSGMSVRLAFAIAAHLEPEILIVDEVLAVGDAQFQRKCMGKMRDVASNEGTTILFVSHNMGAVLSLCSTSILLSAGHVESKGKPGAIVSGYLKNRSLRCEQSWPAERRPGDEVVRLEAVRLKDCAGELTDEIDAESGFWVEIDYEVCIRSPLQVGFRLATNDGVIVLTSTDADGFSDGGSHRAPGRYTARCCFPGGLLVPQTYLLSITADEPNIRSHFLVDGALEFAVRRPLTCTTVDDGRQGIINPVLPWQVARKAEDGSSLSLTSTDWRSHQNIETPPVSRV